LKDGKSADGLLHARETEQKVLQTAEILKILRIINGCRDKLLQTLCIL
jgi:hypothetical protein